jgi:rhomboid protease GluP
MGQWWRLVTAGFLHGGLLHILMNCWVLFDLGAQVEDIYGASRMWVIYLVSSVFGFYVSMVWNPAAPSVGASAALFGLIGAMIALGVRHRNPMGAAIRGMYIRWAVYGLIFSLIPGIDMAAHIGGIVAGFGVGYLAGAPGPEDAASEPIWRVAAWLCILVTVVSFVKMVLAFSRGA